MRGGLAQAAVLALLAWGKTISAQEISAHAVVDSTRYRVGDPIHISVELTHPRGFTFTPLYRDTIGTFLLLDHGQLHAKTDTSTAAEVVVAKYDSGFSVLPPLQFSYLLSGDTLRHTVETNPIVFSIRLVEVDTTQPIKDLKPPISIPVTLAEVLTYIGVVLAILAITYLLYRYWKRRRQAKAGVVEVPPVRPGHLIALEQLAMLREKRLWQLGLIKQYYSELTEILRRYFENRYGITALEKTTDEIMEDIQNYPGVNPAGNEIERVLRRADLVKFARFVPAVPDHEESLSTAFDIVEKTKLREVATPSLEQPTNGEYDRK